MKERLQKIISRSGVASRRAAEKLIREGSVSVNGVVIDVPGSKADSVRDEIRVSGRRISTEGYRVYVALYKPRGYISTLSDPEGRPLVTDLLKKIPERLYPVGRLDYDSEGLILLTNDGSFAHRIQHPSHEIPKTYAVKIRGEMAPGEIDRLRRGITLADGRFIPRSVRITRKNSKSSWIEITVTEGRNRILRRSLELLGKEVTRLVRLGIGTVELGTLKPGEYRRLTHQEVEKLRARKSSKKTEKNLDFSNKINKM
ncbi:MAG: pseudouridine synthase [Deltaproteobacteria bacterium]|nr:pseudouridine synthase [Deltaproteobacteria bacterium]